MPAKKTYQPKTRKRVRRHGFLKRMSTLRREEGCGQSPQGRTEKANRVRYNMLKKSLRLRKKEDFNRIFRYSKPIFFNEIGCRYLFRAAQKVSPQEPLNQSFLRAGFAFSKKHLPLATQRNHLRRVLSEALFQLKDEWPENIDIVFFTIKKPQNINTQEGSPTIKYFLEYIKKNQKRK